MRGALKRLLASGHRVDLIDAHYFYPDGVAAVWLAQEFGLPFNPDFNGPRQEGCGYYQLTIKDAKRSSAV